MNRIRLFGACIAVGGAALLSGCVAYPAGPYYNGAAYPYSYSYPYAYPYSYPYSYPYYPYWGWGGASVVVGGFYGSGYRPYYGGWGHPYWGHGGWGWGQGGWGHGGYYGTGRWGGGGGGGRPGFGGRRA